MREAGDGLRLDLRTDDLPTAVGALETLFALRDLRTTDPERFSLELTVRSGAGLTTVDVHSSGASVRASLEADDVLQAASVQLDRGRFVHGDQRVDPDRPFLLHGPIEAEWADCRTRVLQFDPAALTAFARLAGGDDELRLRSTGWAPVPDDAAVRRWTAVHRTVEAALLELPDLDAHPLVGAALFDLAASALLETFPTTYRPRTEQGALQPSVLVRRARTHIEQHAHEPIRGVDVAAAVGLSTRGLDAAFRRELDTTPTALLRQVRLERAHAELVAGDPTATSVAEIARRWGFDHLGRFAGRFRAAYGINPSDLLRR